MNTPSLTPLLAVAPASAALSAGVHAALATPFEMALTLWRPRYVQLPLHNLAAADLTVLAEDPSVLAADAAVFAFELTVSSE